MGLEDIMEVGLATLVKFSIFRADHQKRQAAGKAIGYMLMLSFCKGLQLTELISRIIFLKNPLLSQAVGAYTVNTSRGKWISGLLSKSQDS